MPTKYQRDGLDLEAKRRVRRDWQPPKWQRTVHRRPMLGMVYLGLGLFVLVGILLQRAMTGPAVDAPVQRAPAVVELKLPPEAEGGPHLLHLSVWDPESGPLSADVATTQASFAAVAEGQRLYVDYQALPAGVRILRMEFVEPPGADP